MLKKAKDSASGEKGIFESVRQGGLGLSIGWIFCLGWKNPNYVISSQLAAFSKLDKMGFSLSRGNLYTVGVLSLYMLIVCDKWVGYTQAMSES